MSPDFGAPFPDKIDFRNFIPPKEATRKTFAETLSTLAQFATSRESTVTRVVFGALGSQERMDIRCALSKRYNYENGKKQDQPHNESSILIFANLRGEPFTLNSNSNKQKENYANDALMDECMIEFVEHIGDKTQAEWLQGAYHDARHAEPELLGESVSHLIETSPVPSVEIITHFGVNEGRKFNNGARIGGVWEEIDLKEFAGPLQYYLPTSFFGIDTPDGMEYSYVRRANGSEQLHVRKKEQGTYTTIGELADDYYAGINNLTEGSLSTFTTALRAAIASGVK